MKIALIAMSGVRVRSRELQSLGVSLPGFVERGRVIASLPSLGLLTIAGATPEDVELRYYEDGDRTPAELEAEGFDVVAVSTYTAQAPEAYALLDRCRHLGLRTALGGLHATVRPEEAAQHADHVFAGEGEETWPEFLTDLRLGRPKRIYDARERVFRLEHAPLPRFDLLDPDRYNRITIQTTRSCPHACTFCASGVLLRGPYRKKPIDRIQRDLEAVTALWPRPFLELADDNTFVDKRWGHKLVETLTPFHLKWFTESDLTLADDLDLVDGLSASGCRQVLVGFESIDAEAVAELEDRPFKASRVADYARTVQKIQERGVSVNGCFILGADHHTTRTFGEIARFADDVGLAEVQVTVLTPFPGTPLYRRLRTEGRLLEEANWGAHTLFDVTYQPRGMSVAELEHGLLETFRSLYAPDRVRARRRHFHAQLRAGRVKHGPRGARDGHRARH